MAAPTLKPRELNGSLARQYDHLQALIRELYRKAAAEDLDPIVAAEIESLNALPKDVKSKELIKELGRCQARILGKVEKELKIVPKEYYQNQWLAIGMAGFGIPMGLVFALVLDNMAFFAIGLPLGLAIGMAYGQRLDQKARDEGRQLDIGLNPR